MRFDIISLFPEPLKVYSDASIIKRAKEEGLVSIHIHQLRDFAFDKHKTVDDTPYGGGAGMLLKIEPLVNCLESVLKESEIPREKTRIIVTSAKGTIYNQTKAQSLSKDCSRIILICGRYEGVDERFIENFCDEELSIGEFVLTGGELPALVVLDSVTRLLPGVLGNTESIISESHSQNGILEYPQFTKPEEFRGLKVPKVLLSGHHKEIEDWRQDQQKKLD